MSQKVLILLLLEPLLRLYAVAEIGAVYYCLNPSLAGTTSPMIEFVRINENFEPVLILLLLEPLLR